MSVIHHFVNGLYCKETYISQDTQLEQHVHEFDHLSILAKGSCVLSVDGVDHFIHAPEVLTIKAHKHHSVYALTDVLWCCLHATDETDPDYVDSVILAKDI